LAAILALALLLVTTNQPQLTLCPISPGSPPYEEPKFLAPVVFTPQPRDGDDVIRGVTFDLCQDAQLYVLLGPLSDAEVIGTTTIAKDGTFVVYLDRPLQSGETITLFSKCRPDIWICLPYETPPPIIPEPTTLLLVGGGLTTLGLKVLRNRCPS